MRLCHWIVISVLGSMAGASVGVLLSIIDGQATETKSVEPAAPASTRMKVIETPRMDAPEQYGSLPNNLGHRTVRVFVASPLASTYWQTQDIPAKMHTGTLEKDDLGAYYLRTKKEKFGIGLNTKDRPLKEWKRRLEPMLGKQVDVSARDGFFEIGKERFILANEVEEHK